MNEFLMNLAVMLIPLVGGAAAYLVTTHIRKLIRSENSRRPLEVDDEFAVSHVEIDGASVSLLRNSRTEHVCPFLEMVKSVDDAKFVIVPEWFEEMAAVAVFGQSPGYPWLETIEGVPVYTTDTVDLHYVITGGVNNSSTSKVINVEEY